MTFSRESVQAEYERLGYSKGWTFLGVPEGNIASAAVAIVGLNPGGGGEKDDYAYRGIWDLPQGNGYYLEKWGPGGTDSPLQRQIKFWHEELGVEPNQSLCANFVPFRSPNWAALERKSEAIAFSARLWRWVLKESPASLFLTMGKLPAWYLAEITGAKLWAQRLPAGWGRQGIDVWDTPDNRRIIAMPHPGRFTLFGRGEASKIASQSLAAAINPKR